MHLPIQDLQILKFQPEKHNGEFMTELVTCYQRVYADGPWHEWMKCPSCNSYYGKKDEDRLNEKSFGKLQCLRCETELIEFWSPREVTDDIKSHITDRASCHIVFCNNLLIGFCWGYPQTRSELIEKLGIDVWPELEIAFGPREEIIYQAEMGLLPEYRSIGIAQILYNLRTIDFGNSDIDLEPVGVVRVRENPEPSKTFLWYKYKLKYETLKKYPDPDGRLILAKEMVGKKS